MYGGEGEIFGWMRCILLQLLMLQFIGGGGVVVVVVVVNAVKRDKARVAQHTSCCKSGINSIS